MHNAAALEAMNLTPGVARVDQQTRAAFEEFKFREAADKAKRECVPPWCQVLYRST